MRNHLTDYVQILNHSIYQSIEQRCMLDASIINIGNEEKMKMWGLAPFFRAEAS